MMLRGSLFLCWLVFVLGGCATRDPQSKVKVDSRTALLMQELNGFNHAADAERAAQFVPIPAANPAVDSLVARPTNFFRLGPGDVVQIEMLGEPESQSIQSVGPDGRIYYNILPGLFVWGMTLTEAKAALENGLARSLKVKPEIAITLNVAQSGKVWMLGSVQRPGVYSLANSLTMLELVSMAGGLQNLPGSTEEMVDLENSFVMRKGEPLRINFHTLLRKGDLSQNIFLQPDDFIFIRPAAHRQIYVLGAVIQPNSFDFTPGMTLVSAIARAGGPARYAFLTQVGVVRGSLAKPSVAEVNYKGISKGQVLDFPLEAGDIVYVPFSPYMKIEQLGDQILRQFISTIAVNEGQRAVIPNATPVGVTTPVIVAP